MSGESDCPFVARCEGGAALVTPERIQLRRTKGWRKPEGAIVVARPTKWGNPFAVDGDWIMWTAVGLGYRGDPKGRREAAVALHRAWITGQPVPIGQTGNGRSGGVIEFSDGSQRTLVDHALGIARVVSSLLAAPVIPDIPNVEELRGHDLACWCSLDQPCHADTLLDLANR